MALALRARGFSAPKIYAADYDAGLIVLEDLGNELVVEGDPPRPMIERYAVRHRSPGRASPARPAGRASGRAEGRLRAAELRPRRVSDRGRAASSTGICPHRNAGASAETRAHFQTLWRDALRPVLEAPKSWVLRDFHSPNLLWLEGRDGIAKIGLLDFQDAVLGPSAYDVASLLQDARVDVPEDVEIALFGRYVAARRHADPGFDANAFARLYATLAAQRSTKILGIFARLDRRDHKPQYLRHMPRVWNYLRRALAHPALQALDAWYLRNVPPPG